MSIIHGVQTTKEMTPILVDSQGRVIVSTITPSLENPQGIISAAINTTLPAGGSDQTAYTVPVNQRYILNHISMIYVGTVAGVILTPIVNISGQDFGLGDFGNLVNGRYIYQDYDIVIEAGGVLKIRVSNATLNDDLYMFTFSRRIL